MARLIGPAWRRFVDDVAVPRWRIARQAPSAGAWATAGVSLLSFVRGLLPVVFVISMSEAVGSLPASIAGGPGSAAWSHVQSRLIIALGALLGQHILEPVQTALGEVLARKIDAAVYGRLISAALGGSDIARLEKPQTLDHLAEATRELESAFRTPGAAYAGLIALIGRYVQVLGFAVTVGVFYVWWAGALLVCVTMIFRHGQRGGLRKYSKVFPAVAPLRRRAQYLRDLALAAPAAKEIRVFGLVHWLSGLYRDAYRRSLAPVWSERRRIYLKPYFGFTAAGLVLLCVLLSALGAEAAFGHLSLTALAVTAQAALAMVKLGEFYPEADTHTQFGMNAINAVQRFEDALHGPDLSAPAAVHGSDIAPFARAVPAMTKGIRIEGLEFAYEGAASKVFDGLDLFVPAGKCTAIVGVNGAGKTTLVKLMARLYSPQRGAIFADEVDIGALPLAAWRRSMAVVFQDFLRYELPASDNIGFGCIEALDDLDAVAWSARRAGIMDALDAAPNGIHTVLSRTEPDGIGLSGGQWQRIAIARALFALRHGASVFIMDEPTSALDARAEAAFFADFQKLTRGSTSILISHRFSSVRHADHIVVLDGGRVVESGSHEELMRRAGRYANLFEIQAEQFRDRDSMAGAIGRVS